MLSWALKSSVLPGGHWPAIVSQGRLVSIGSTDEVGRRGRKEGGGEI